MRDRLPIIILGGSDPRPGKTPRGLRPEQMLTGFKGARLLPGGRCLAAELIERIRASERFREPLLVGPRRVYEPLVDVPIVDAEGDLAVTLQHTIASASERYDLTAPLALISCDILPSAGEFRQLLDETYQLHQDACLWGQLIQANPQQMGASAWKPAYAFRPASGQPPLRLYPGHLIVARLAALRLDLAIQLLQTAYRSRNRELRQRPLRLIAGSLWQLFREDGRNVWHGQWPILSISIPGHALAVFRRYRRGDATLADFEQAVGYGLLHRQYRQQAPSRSVIFSLTQIRSFAKDIDTIDEFAEAAELAGRQHGP